MPDVKVSGIPADTGLDDNHYVVLNDPVGPTTKTTTLGVLRAWLQSVATWVRSSMVDYSSFAFNLKVSYMTSTASPGGSSTNNFGSSGNGLRINATVAATCKALIEVMIATSSTSDFEFHPILYVNGVEIKRLTPVAAPGFAGNRATIRGIAAVVDLAAGANTIDGGAFYSSGTALSVPASAAYIQATILGNVTA